MLADIKYESLINLIKDLNREELIWVNGYITGLTNENLKEVQNEKFPQGRLTITFGTETGNSKNLASHFASRARKSGLIVKLSSLDQYRLSDLSKEEYFVTVISTHGEGDPPEAAKSFYNHLHNSQLKLDQLKYSVLALGDRAYPLFCKAGEEVDQKLDSLGARRIAPIAKCDTDYEEQANQWFEYVMSVLKSSSTPMINSLPIPAKSKSARNKFKGTVLSNINLNGAGSQKETFHMEINAPGVSYEPGDAIGLIPQNPIGPIRDILDILEIDERRTILYNGQDVNLNDLLINRLNIFHLSERVIRKYSVLVNQEIPDVKMDLLNLLKIYPVRNDQYHELFQLLEPIIPRLYSIASSVKVHPEEVNLTVARTTFQVDSEKRFGLCSDYLCNLKPGSSFEFYVHTNHSFHLPDADKDIIMIGPGTGVAPFRAFMEERTFQPGTGRSWLFFGDQHFESDFLYQTEWQDLYTAGILTNINVAFSRDQEKKIYVQNKMLQHAEELFQWITSGAYIFICGTRSPMSIEVEGTILKIMEDQGQLSPDQAVVLLDQLKEEGRYLKDVY